MTAPTPETLDWLRQCAAAPGARWHRALLAEVEGQAPPEIEPIPAEGLAWLQQSARVHGATYSQVLLHVLERIELLDQDAIEQSQSNSFCFEAVIKRLEKLEAALQQPTCKEVLTGSPQLTKNVHQSPQNPKPTMFILPLALLFDPSSLGPFNTNTLPGTAIICIDPVVGVGTCRPINAPGAPGPAPLLGVAAGLHWSRRLRRRIKTAAPVTIPMEETPILISPNSTPMPQSPPPRIIRRPAAEGEPARFEAAWSPEAPATPAERLAAAQQKRRQRPARLFRP